MSAAPEQLDDLYGARIEHVEVRADERIVLVFGHRGTDDGSGYLIVEPDDVHFNDGGDPDSWRSAAGDPE